MRRSLLFTALLALFALLPACAAAQMPFGLDDESWDAERPREAPRQTVLPFATALEASFSSSTWVDLKISTRPAAELTRLLYRGFYRQELLQLVLLAQKVRVPLDEVVRRREKGATLRVLASDYKVDGDALYREAEALRAPIDARAAKVSTSTAVVPLLPGTTVPAPAPGVKLKDAPADTALSTTTIVMPGGEKVRTELAISDADQERGLMFRTELPSDYGMLFVFKGERIIPFWMKNTWVDLDILYLDREGRITKVFSRVPHSQPDTPDEKVARIHAWGKYVLELPAGAAKRYRLKKGQKLKFPL